MVGTVRTVSSFSTPGCVWSLEAWGLADPVCGRLCRASWGPVMLLEREPPDRLWAPSAQRSKQVQTWLGHLLALCGLR